MDVFILKKLEGKKVTVIANIGNKTNVYSNIIYKLTSKGTIEFKDNKEGNMCYVSSDCINIVREECGT